MNSTVVDTTSGKVQGAISRGTVRFKGIPYAAPPVGDRRFAAPEPVDPEAGIIDGTAKPTIAPQPLGAMEALAGAVNLPEQSEAGCLTLNVWTESLDESARRPVMVWIHGGGFTGGSGSTAWYDGVNLAKRGVVVVTINYRLGALGFLHLAGLGGERFAGSANAGLLDQALALKWVADNITAFGGDPDKVTIFGESAGGMSVGCQLALPASRGLFRTAIAQSGAAKNVHTAERAEKVAVSLLEALGLAPNDVKALCDLPVDAILEAQAKLSGRSRIEAGLMFSPAVDGDTMPVSPRSAIADGQAAGITLVAGWNAEEMKLFTAMDPKMKNADEDRLRRVVERVLPTDDAGIDAALAAYREALGPDATPGDVAEAVLTDSVFRIPAIDMLDLQHPNAPATYAYEFRYKAPNFGAAHAVEIPFAFDNLDAPGAAFFTGEADDGMRHLATEMADAWVAIARDGDPGDAWPSYDPVRRATRILDSTGSTVEDDPGASTRRLWS